jgi:MFS family permease
LDSGLGPVFLGADCKANPAQLSCKWLILKILGSANGDRTRIFRLLVFPLKLLKWQSQAPCTKSVRGFGLRLRSARDQDLDRRASERPAENGWMGSIARPPCDEAAIRSSRCSQPAVNGPWILAATILGSSMAFIDGTVVNVALPALQSALHATLSDVQWVVEAYALFLAALLLVGGVLGDLYGRRKAFIIGVAVFAAASIWCGCAPNIRWLIVARGVQGIGGALLIPGSLALISANFSEEERGRAIGTWSGFTSITAAVGPVLGGWFTQHGSWRWVFFINVPLGLAVILLSVWKVPESTGADRSRRFDWAGGVFAVLGLGGIVFGLINAMPAIGFGGAIILVGLLFWEARSPSPMPSWAVPLPQFQRRESADALSLFCLERHAVLLAIGFDPGAGLHSDRGWRRSPPLHPVDVFVVSLVGWAARSIWRKSPLNNRPVSRGDWLCAMHPASHRGIVLDHVLSGARRARTWHGD